MDKEGKLGRTLCEIRKWGLSMGSGFLLTSLVLMTPYASKFKKDYGGYMYPLLAQEKQILHALKIHKEYKPLNKDNLSKNCLKNYLIEIRSDPDYKIQKKCLEGRKSARDIYYIISFLSFMVAGFSHGLLSEYESIKDK